MATRNNPVAGILWMLVSCALLSLVAALGRYVAMSGLPTAETVFLRLLFALLAMAPILALRGPGMLRTRHLPLYAIRVGIGLIGMTAWFAALAHITVGEVTAIGFLAPIFGTVGAALILGEIVRWRRWLSTLIGLAGALIILRPGFETVGIGTWYALLAAAGMSAAGLFIKALADRDEPDTVVLITLMLQTPVMGIAAAFVWIWPQPHIWTACVGLGVMGMLGHITLTRAFAAADASLIMSLEFARLPFAVAFGFMMFGELIDFWTWIGAGVIFAASLYNAHRERALRRATGREHHAAH